MAEKKSFARPRTRKNVQESFFFLERNMWKDNPKCINMGHKMTGREAKGDREEEVIKNVGEFS